MNTLSLLALLALGPIVNVGGPLTSWLISIALLVVVVLVVVYLVTKVAGAPSIPAPFNWILWFIVAIALIVFVFFAFGIGLP